MKTMNKDLNISEFMKTDIFTGKFRIPAIPEKEFSLVNKNKNKNKNKNDKIKNNNNEGRDTHINRSFVRKTDKKLIRKIKTNSIKSLKHNLIENDVWYSALLLYYIFKNNKK